LEPRRRSEQALVAVVQEAYVNGVSTRKVDRLVEALGLPGRAVEVTPQGRCQRFARDDAA
jgi:transposase-like protein